MTWTNFTVHWKSTVKGILVFLITTCVALMKLNILTPKLGSIATVIIGLGSAWMGIISLDPGTVLASLPGQAPKAVPSTEVPIDPKETVVK